MNKKLLIWICMMVMLVGSVCALDIINPHYNGTSADHIHTDGNPYVCQSFVAIENITTTGTAWFLNKDAGANAEVYSLLYSDGGIDRPDTLLAIFGNINADTLQLSTGRWENFTTSGNSHNLVYGNKYWTCINNSAGGARIGVGGVTPNPYGNGTARYGASITVGTEWFNYDYSFMLYNEIQSSSPTGSVQLGLQSPTNDTISNSPLNFSYNVNSTNSSLANCSLLINGVINTTNSTPTNNTDNTFYSFSLADNNYNWSVSCFDVNGNSGNTTNRSIIIDSIQPYIYSNFVNGSVYYQNNLTGLINFSDENLYRVLILVNEHPILNVTGLTGNTYNYTLNYDYGNLSIGINNLYVESADGHTAKQIDNYQWTDGIWNNYLSYTTKTSRVTITPDGSIFDTMTTEKLKDRYTFEYNPNDKTKSKYVFTVTSNNYIDIVNNPESKWHTWLVTGNNWVDFYEEERPTEIPSYKRISDTEVEVTIKSKKNNVFKFSSIGDLNINSVNYTFFGVNVTETYETDILNGFATTLSLNITGLINQSYTTKLFWNNTNYTTTQSFVNGDSIYTKSVTTPIVPSSTNITHKWYFTITNPLETTLLNQSVWTISIDDCTSNIYPIANITYYDEVSNDVLNVTNSYVLNFTDGTFNYDLAGSFAEGDENVLCTNLQPSLFTFDWNMWGTMTLSKTAYITRVLNFAEAEGYIISNDPMIDIELYMVATADSNTVTYTWFTTQYQPVDGTMLIYKCNGDGSKSLVESVNIVGSNAVANIILLTQPYSYNVVVDSVVYDGAGYAPCHVESASTATYYVDLISADTTPYRGTIVTDCEITKQGDNIAQLSWGTNPESSATLTGCMFAERSTIYGWTEIYRNCSSTENPMLRTIPDSGFNYIVRGALYQGDASKWCTSQIEFHDDNSTAVRFGISGVFAVALLIIAMALFYAGEGVSPIVGGIAAIIIAFIFGILNFGIITTSAIVSFLLIFVFIGRYAKSK